MSKSHVPAFPQLSPESNSDEDLDEHEVTGPPLVNTLDSVLSLFPLAETRNKILGNKRQRPEEEQKVSVLDENKTRDLVISPLQLKEVLFPTEEELFSDSFARVDIEAGQPIKKRKLETQVSSISKRVESMLQVKKVVLVKPKLNNLFRTQLFQRSGIPTKEEKKALEEKERAVVEASPIKQYSYMVPNEFGVRMVTPYTLFDYQMAAAKWMIDLEEGKNHHQYYAPGQNGGLLAMVMGLGKTPTAATLVARTLNQQRMERSCTLYVCPKNLLGTVMFQFEKFFGNQIKVLIYHRDFLRSAYDKFDANEIRKYDVIISNYASLVARVAASSIVLAKSKKDQVKEKPLHKIDAIADSFCKFPWFRIILDESHEIREKNTIRFKAMMCLNSSRRFCVTGTPIYNRVSDIYHQLEFTGLRLHRGIKYTKNNLKDLDLMKLIRFVEYKDAQSVKLPRKTVHKIHFQLSEEEKILHAYYMQSARAIFEKIQGETGRDKGKRTMEAHVSMIRVMQICSAPYLITPASKVTEEKDGGSEDMMDVPPAIVFPTDNAIDQWIQVRDSAAGLRSSKMNQFVKTMKELRENADEKNVLKLVVFANYTSTLRLAIAAVTASDPEHNSRNVFIHGGIASAHKREELYTKFRVQPQIEVLYMTLKLGAIGLNLSEANKVIFLEPWFSFSALSQGESRVHRIGQMRPVDIYYFLAADSAEERVYRTAQAKKDLAEDIASQQDSKLNFQEMRYILFDNMDTN